MHRKSLLGVALVAVLALVRVEPANALTYLFSFENVMNGGGTVTGMIDGLNEGTGAATSVAVVSNTAGFGVAEYALTAETNTWTVTGGIITAYSFYSFGAVNPMTDASLFFDSSNFNGLSFRAGLSDMPRSVVSHNTGITSADIGIIMGQTASPTSPSSPAAVPVPASLPLLAAGVAALAFVRRRSR